MIRITRNDDIQFNVDEIHGKGDRYNITFYTVNNAVNIVKHDTDVHDGIIVLNGSELMTLGEGVMNLRVDNIAPNAGYNDGVYNSSFTKTTKYYIQAGIIVPDGSDTQTVIEIVGELQDALNGEISRSTAKDTAHDTAIANEVTARANADSALSDRITANTTAITNEATARANADSALSDRITANATAIANTYTKQEVDDLLDDIDLPDNIVTDANYTHTDNNFTTTEKNKLAGIAAGAEVNVQSDWNVTNTSSDAYIKNKPTKVSDFTNDAGYLTSYTETDPTVPSWAKAQTKPTYTANEVGALPSDTTIPSKTSDLTNDSGFVTGSKIYVGTCTTAAATMPKVCTVETFPTDTNGKPLLGTTIAVKFTATNTGTSNRGLDVNGTGSAPVWYNTGVTTSNNYYGYASRYIQYFWDGTNWVFLTWGYDANTTYTNVALGQGYATQNNNAASATITAALSSYALTTGGIVSVKFTYDVPAGATLNINGKGAKAIYNKDAAITAGVIKAGDTATFIYNTYYRLISVDSWQDNTGGGSSGDDTQQVIIKMVYDDDDDVYSFTDVNDTAMTNAQVIQLLNDTDKDVKIEYDGFLYNCSYKSDDGYSYEWVYYTISYTNSVRRLYFENCYGEGDTGISVDETYNTIPTNIAQFGCGFAVQNNSNNLNVTASLSNYTLVNGGIVVVKFTRTLSANATLNINSRGAFAIYKDGARIKSGVIPANSYGTFVYSSGAYYLLNVSVPKSSDCQDAPMTFGTNSITYTLSGYGCYKLGSWGNNTINTVTINLTPSEGTEPVHTILFDPNDLDLGYLTSDVAIRYNGANVSWDNSGEIPDWAHFNDDYAYIVVKVYNCKYATFKCWE